MIVNNNYYVNISRINGSQRAIPSGKPDGKVQGSFEEILESKVNENRGLKFSKHAEMRLQLRNIKLTDEQKEKISKAVQKAEEKGVKDSLVLIDDIAFVVNVRNRTVITAVNSNELKENVFTNIDGAVFA
ncbi:MAG TPA: flagellar biosynthesis protein [Hungateiclostridium thermocellum]|uniref:Flagellar operon protein n=2 Tax=Acetivibrio thermocellus TaxID=1515 RepID=A3DCN2_ACET2|nr:TIGR02530 family flagellar biosynthesis protein [Acetivibrio thermocellus]CDG35187.1 flagellar operon protein [Acetivibrio thermocellus BC1]ABN51711.1 flagellar operon protein [Acetivibrio thermocellus ATCC 27405]ADU74804.1 flagellar operon protein [Acetivibrio thermocellus DSM 1313]ALX08757.1 flagellar operon protein [Acetivibrio thermocellus AD2]ANV76508.1 flagellar operon protein [Acetivibrio thermocellus DSM 2360]